MNRDISFALLAGGIAFGGALGPVALVQGLTMSAGATDSLLLNPEAVLTALIAWIVFRENADRRVVMGMISIVAGGVVLAWPQGGSPIESSWLGPLSIEAARQFRAIDNELTRKGSSTDALLVAGSKGLAASTVNMRGCGVILVLFVWAAGRSPKQS